MKTATVLAVLIFCWSACSPPDTVKSKNQQRYIVNLDQGWKYSNGDDLTWTEPSYDDRQWQPFNPSDDIHVYLQKNPNPHTAWLRLGFTIPPDWPQEQLAITVIQSVASEIYLDGKRVAQYGTMNPGGQKTKEYDPHLEPIPFNAPPGSHHSLAVRFAVSGHAKYTTLFEFPNPVFRTELKPIGLALDEYRHIHANQTGFLAVLIGINLMIFIVHGFFFLMNRAQKANLYLSLSGFVYLVGYLIQGQYFLHSPHHTDRYLLGNLTFIMFQYSNWLLYLAILHFLDRKRDVIFWLLAAYFIIAVGMNLSWYDQGWRMGGALFQILVWINLLRICVSARKEGRKGAGVFAIGTVISILSFALFILQGTYNTESDYLRNLSLVRQLTYMISWLGITGSVSAFLAWDFSMTSKQLSRKLAEVEDLSERNIAMEKEKQDILASQNQQLEENVRQRTAELNRSLEELKATQAQLIQSEKMASLGELTAGIAHEIQNPLNFVNNFSDLNNELIEELQEELKKGDIREAASIAENLKDNESKINLHGKRAEGIIKSMLQHSRSSSGQKEPTDVNKLVDEYVRLAYHGYRARKKDFNVTLDILLDPETGSVPMVAQDIGRVLLNLLNNAFHAVEEKTGLSENGYQPKVTVSTKRSPQELEIRVEDNGAGIPEAIRDKIFQPFFTTKPTGQGTGMGLSLSYDIVKAHGGNIQVECRAGEGSAFNVGIPISM